MNPTSSSVSSGRAVVATAGTAVRLSTSKLPCRRVVVTALSTNTNVVTVGGSDVVGAAATRKGVGLAAGSTYGFDVHDVSDLYVDAVTNGEGVSFAVMSAN